MYICTYIHGSQHWPDMVFLPQQLRVRCITDIVFTSLASIFLLQRSGTDCSTDLLWCSSRSGFPALVFLPQWI